MADSMRILFPALIRSWFDPAHGGIKKTVIIAVSGEKRNMQVRLPCVLGF
jgi:hypothetical protein